MLRALIPWASVAVGACAGPGVATRSVPEHCNGVDDDGDGVIDEGFEDGDRNGRPDCLDATCWALAEAQTGPIPAELCLRPSVEDPWAIDTLWAYSGAARGLEASWSTIAVAHLADDDGDGVIGDADDHPEVVFVAFPLTDAMEPTLVALDGRTGEELWAVPGPDVASGVAIADVDGDREPDIVTIDAGSRLTLYAPDGSLRDVSARTLDRTSTAFGGDPLVADLDGDSDVEIFAAGTVFAGANLQPLFTLDRGDTWEAIPAIADADGDGDKEIAYAGALFDSDGEMLWGPLTLGKITSAQFVQADADDDAEVLFLGNELRLFEVDGTELARWTPQHTPDPGCAADFDGDGATEIGAVSGGVAAVYEVDGSLRWSRSWAGPSGPCAAADLDGDGAAELLYSSREGLHVLDGPTGAERFRGAAMGRNDAPVVVDLDGDGSPEILGATHELAETSAPPLAWALTHRHGGWPEAPRVRPSFDYDGANIRDDGSVPNRPAPAWLANGGPRSSPVQPASQFADLSAALLDACVGDPGFGPVVVTAQVTNRGQMTAPAGATLTLRADDGDGEPRVVARATLPELPAGTIGETVWFTLRPEEVGAVGWRLEVDEEGRVLECDDTDNSDTMERP